MKSDLTSTAEGRALNSTYITLKLRGVEAGEAVRGWKSLMNIHCSQHLGLSIFTLNNIPISTAKQENHQTQGVSPYVSKNAQNNSNHITGHSNRILNQNFFFKKIYLAGPGLCCGVRTLSYGMWDLVLQPGMEPGSLHWELGGLATGLPLGSPRISW